MRFYIGERFQSEIRATTLHDFYANPHNFHKMSTKRAYPFESETKLNIDIEGHFVATQKIKRLVMERQECFDANLKHICELLDMLIATHYNLKNPDEVRTMDVIIDFLNENYSTSDTTDFNK